jgi:hypothetical protein
MNSCSTLRTLVLGHQHPILASRMDHSPLDRFCNLKELEIRVSSPSLFQYLLTSALRLEVVKFSFSTLHPLGTFVPAIMSPSLRSVKRFGVFLSILDLELGGYLEGSEIEPYWRPVVPTISRLPLLEVIHFDAPLQTAWSSYFEGCRHLQHLVWAVALYELRPCQPVQQVGIIFADALGHIHPTPRVVIIDRNDEVPRCHDIWWNTRPEIWTPANDP